MAAIGNSPTQQAFTPAVDFFSGNGSTTAFTLSRPVASVAQVQVTIDNVAQNPSSAYTVSSNTITFTSAPLSGTNNIYVYYTSPITQVIAPGQGTVTTTSLASSTGTGAVVLATSPTITTPVLGAASATSITVAAGAVGTPSITTAGDTNTGIFFPAADTIAFSEGGTESMRIDSSGNVLVGITSNPSGLFKIVAAGTDNNNLIGSYNTASGNAGLRLQANQAGLYLQGSGTVDPLYISNTSSNGYISFRPGSDTERVRLVSNGTLMIGTTSETPADPSTTKGIALNNSSATSSQIYATGSNDTCAVFNRAGSDGATVRLRRQGSDVGNISVTGSTTTFNSTSDYRLKENVQPMTDALAKVAQLKPVTYKWKVDGSNGQGFIAHELAEVVPDCVTGKKDALDKDGNPDYQGIDTSFLVATLTAAIQELKAINDTQAETINALTARIEALENR